MIINYLKLTNFQSYIEDEIDFNGLSVTSIIGQYIGNPKKSNGAGKSSIFDAIVYALYGKTRTSLEEELIRYGEESMEVEIEFSLGDQENIQVKRGKTTKGGYLNLFINDKDETEDGRSAKNRTQQKIIDKIGMDFELFTATVFFQQEKSDKFTSSTPAERKNYLKKLLRLEIYDECYAIVNSEMKTQKREIDNIQSQIDYINEEIEDVKIEKIKKDLEKNKTNLSEIEEKINTINKNIKESMNLKQQQENLKQQVDNLNEEYNELIDEIDDCKHNLEEIKKEISEVKTFGKKITQSELDKIQEQGNKLKDEIQKIEIELKGIETKNEFHYERVDTLEKNDDCPICSNHLSFEKKDKLINEIKKQISQNVQQQTMYEKKLKQFNKQLEELRNGYKKQKEIMKEQLDAENKKKENEIELKSIEKNIKDIKLKQQQKNKKIIELKDKLSKIKIDKNLDKKEEELNLLRDNRDDIISNIASLEKIIKDYQKKKRELTKYKKDFDERNWEYNCYNILKDIFGKNGIVAEIIKSSIDEIEYNANQILSDLNDGEFQIIIETMKETKGNELRDTLDIYVQTNNSIRRYESFSGGQRSIINFAIRMSLSQMLSKTNNVAFGFIGLDEVIGALDEFNKERMIDVINYLKDTFNQIFIISHTNLRECFENMIFVEFNKKTETSRIKEIV